MRSELAGQAESSRLRQCGIRHWFVYSVCLLCLHLVYKESALLKNSTLALAEVRETGFSASYGLEVSSQGNLTCSPPKQEQGPDRALGPQELIPPSHKHFLKTYCVSDTVWGARRGGQKSSDHDSSLSGPHSLRRQGTILSPNGKHQDIRDAQIQIHRGITQLYNPSLTKFSTLACKVQERRKAEDRIKEPVLCDPSIQKRWQT